MTTSTTRRVAVNAPQSYVAGQGWVAPTTAAAPASTPAPRELLGAVMLGLSVAFFLGLVYLGWVALDTQRAEAPSAPVATAALGGVATLSAGASVALGPTATPTSLPTPVEKAEEAVLYVVRCQSPQPVTFAWFHDDWPPSVGIESYDNGAEKWLRVGAWPDTRIYKNCIEADPRWVNKQDMVRPVGRTKGRTP